ncbi:MAG: sugar transferase [Anaerolineaceae bacterium]|nr:sugar transferase [Anaerolineaceae bacterium]
MKLYPNDPTPPTLANPMHPIRRINTFKLPFSERRLLLLVVDACLVLLAVAGAFLWWQNSANQPINTTLMRDRWYWFPIMLVSWCILAGLNDLYDIPTSCRRTLTAVRVTVTGGLGFIIYWGVYFVSSQSLPRLFVIFFLVLVMPAIILWRWIYSYVFFAPPFRHRVLIIGANDRGTTIAQALKREPLTNYQVVGFLDNTPQAIDESLGHTPILGTEKDVLHVAKQMEVQEAVIALEKNLERPLFSQLVECQAQGIEVSWMPDLYERVCRSVPIQHVDPAWALSAMQGAPLIGRFQLAAKRLLDLAVVILAAPIFLLLIPAIALAIVLDSPGPVFYTQIRCGRAGKKFKIIKFRTMVDNAEKDGKPQWARKRDPRITRVGRFLRKSRLDELPQIINVLLNEMSLVGPRPERPEFVETLEKEVRFYRTRLTVKPGITGWAQIHYDYGNSVEDALIKLQYDFYYIRYLSVVLDIYILFRTIGVLLKLKGT